MRGSKSTHHDLDERGPADAEMESRRLSLRSSCEVIGMPSWPNNLSILELRTPTSPSARRLAATSGARRARLRALGRAAIPEGGWLCLVCVGDN